MDFTRIRMHIRKTFKGLTLSTTGFVVFDFFLSVLSHARQYYERAYTVNIFIIFVVPSMWCFVISSKFDFTNRLQKKKKKNPC